MSEETKKEYADTPIADGEHYARARWRDIKINEKSGNLNLSVLWVACNEDGSDLAENYEAVSGIYTIAYAEEAANIKKCAGKPLDYIEKVAPKTAKAMRRILEWAPDWPHDDPFWFMGEDFGKIIVRITVIHDPQWGAQAKFTNGKERKAKEQHASALPADVLAKFGFRTANASVSSSVAQNAQKRPSDVSVKIATDNASSTSKGSDNAPVPPETSQSMPDSAPMPSPAREATKADCWNAYCRGFDGSDTKKWFSYIHSHGNGNEKTFTPADWGAICDAIERDGLPF